MRAPRFLYNTKLKLKAIVGILLAFFILDIGSALVYPNVEKYRRYDPKMSSMMEYRIRQVRAEGISEAKFMEAANKAKEGCPVSKVLNARITMDAKLE